ncbi:MAG: hypothetical protein ACHQNA_01950 [Acidimicrobiales bacterium]
MDLRAEVELPCTLAAAHGELDELDGYPEWLGIVRSTARAAADGDDAGPAWWVDLGAGVGPLQRTKRVRMARTAVDRSSIRFERRETDGVEHAPWALSVELEEGVGRETVTFITLSLWYGGTAWVPLLDAVLATEVRRAGRRLVARVAGNRGPGSAADP